jgi:multiple antibiotic resistance protein
LFIALFNFKIRAIITFLYEIFIPFSLINIKYIRCIMIFALFPLILKKIVILFTLLDPIGLVPLFLTATAGSDKPTRKRFTRTVVITALSAMLISAVLGNQLLSFFGVSMGSMKVGGGLIALMIAFGMILGHEKAMKQTEQETQVAKASMQIVPLAIPLLAGPAVLSFVMANSTWGNWRGWVESIVPIIVVCFMTWIVFRISIKFQNRIRPEILSLIERLAGFLLSMLAVEMIVSGLKLLFPSLN